MSTEVEQGWWLPAAVKSLGVAITAAIAWVWNTSHRQALAEQRITSLATSQRRIEKGVGWILNHLTGTKLHDIDLDED